MKTMNEWFVDAYDDSVGPYFAAHYVGGEEPLYIDTKEYDTRHLAFERALELNRRDIKYTFTCFEDDCRLKIEGDLS